MSLQHNAVGQHGGAVDQAMQYEQLSHLEMVQHSLIATLVSSKAQPLLSTRNALFRVSMRNTSARPLLQAVTHGAVSSAPRYSSSGAILGQAALLTPLRNIINRLQVGRILLALGPALLAGG